MGDRGMAPYGTARAQLKQNGGTRFWKAACAAAGALQRKPMTLEAVLAALHLVAILTFVVFLSSQAALCRTEWMSAAVVERLARLDVIYGVAAVLMIASGLARLFWGIKGISWYVSQPMFHIKITIVVAMAVLSVWPSIMFRRWRRDLRATGVLPDALQVKKVRRLVMIQSHVLPVVAVIAVFWARGW
jgi:putative membrane protein